MSKNPSPTEVRERELQQEIDRAEGGAKAALMIIVELQKKLSEMGVPLLTTEHPEIDANLYARVEWLYDKTRELQRQLEDTNTDKSDDQEASCGMG